MLRETKLVIIGSLVAILLQVILAPNIIIFQVMPNFILLYTLVVSMLIPLDSILIIAFILGLICDLLGYGPVGGMAFLLTLAAFAAQRLHAVFDSNSVGAPLLILIVLALLVDLCYAIVLLLISTDISPMDAFVYRALPCALYDCVLGLVLYPFAIRALMGSQPHMKSVSPSQFR